MCMITKENSCVKRLVRKGSLISKDTWRINWFKTGFKILQGIPIWGSKSARFSHAEIYCSCLEEVLILYVAEVKISGEIVAKKKYIYCLLVYFVHCYCHIVPRVCSIPLFFLPLLFCLEQTIVFMKFEL